MKRNCCRKYHHRVNSRCLNRTLDKINQGQTGPPAAAAANSTSKWMKSRGPGPKNVLNGVTVPIPAVNRTASLKNKSR